MSRRRPLLLAATGALLLASCGAATEDTTATVTDSTTDTTPEVLRFSAPLVGGGTFDGASVAGTPVAFWFWAPT